MKHAYTPPKLTTYGSFSTLTASGSGTMAENDTGMGMGQWNRRP